MRGPVKRWRGRGGAAGDAEQLQADGTQFGGEWHTGKLAGYISKYLGKGVDASEAWSKRYWSTRLDAERKPVREVFWIQALDGHMLIEEVYELVVGSRAVGVRQFLLPGDDVRYWVQAPPLPA